jgi:hypothetical protein
MFAWVLRIIGIAVALVAGYLAYLAAHQVIIALLCSAVAAVLAIVSVIFLWDRPKIGTPFAAAFLVAGVVAHMLVTPRGGPVTQAFVAAFPTPSAFASMQPASGALSAPQPGVDYSDFIGHGTIDDGMTGPNISQTTSHAVSQAAAAFGGPQATPLWSANAQKLIDADAKLPASEYSLPMLAMTLPNDPIAIYRFVRDNVTTDPYDGIMRGPIGTWLSRAGSPSDKLSLLAWLLVNKHIPIQFVRSTLSDDERNRIIASATSTPDDTTPQPAPSGSSNFDSVIGKYVSDGNTFAQWSSQQLTSSNVPLGNGNMPQISSKHYWIQIDQNGKVVDLDPSLRDMSEGQHLGTTDPTFKPWAMLPADEWHYIRIMLTGKFADGTALQIVIGQSKTCDVAYAPVRLVIAPTGGSDVSHIPGARKFVVALLAGGTTLAPATQIDLDAHGGITQMTLEIDRKDSDGRVLTSTRNLLMPETPRELQGPSVAGLTSILVVPGLGSNAFEIHEFIRTLAALWNSFDTAKAGRMKPTSAYPVALAEFFARDEGVADRLVQQTNGRFYRGRTDIALERTWYAVDHGAAHVVLGFDIVDNSMAGVGIDASQAAVANLARGYADTEIEGDVIGGNVPYNAIAVFNSANSSGVNPVVLTSGSNAPAVGEFADGLSQTLAAGDVAIAPNATVTVSGGRAYGWWDIDPHTGSAVGRVTGGAGDSMAEYGFLLEMYGDFETAGEVYHAYHECGGASVGNPGSVDACGSAMCNATFAQFLAARGRAHAHHIGSPWRLLSAIAVDATIAAAATFVLCAEQHPGGHGGGGGGGH